MLEAFLPREIPPALQSGEGGGQQTRRLHVLLLASHQTPGRPTWGAPVCSLWLGSPEGPLLHQSRHLLLWEQTSQGLHTGQYSSCKHCIALKTLQSIDAGDWQYNITDLLC